MVKKYFKCRAKDQNNMHKKPRRVYRPDITWGKKRSRNSR